MQEHEIHDDLLTPDGMNAARQAIVNQGGWFIHSSPLENFPLIRCEGLQPRNPGQLPPSVVTRRLGADAGTIVCLRWRQSGTPIVVNKDQPLFRLALQSNDLPVRIGLDWSSPDWALAAVVHRDAPGRNINEVLVDIVRRSGLLISYDPINSSDLRACPAAAPDSEPSVWPQLEQLTDITQLAKFHG